MGLSDEALNVRNRGFIENPFRTCLELGVLTAEIWNF